MAVAHACSRFAADDASSLQRLAEDVNVGLPATLPAHLPWCARGAFVGPESILEAQPGTSLLLRAQQGCQLLGFFSGVATNFGLMSAGFFTSSILA